MWYCEVCDLVYNEMEGMPDHGVPAGTAFEDIPEEWHCPDCGIDKTFFRRF